MDIQLKRSTVDEANRLLSIQKEAFKDDLMRYQDYETNPSNEPVERLIRKIELFDHYTVWHDQSIIGGVDIRMINREHRRINRIFLKESMQHRGIGSRIMRQVEQLYPEATEWSLDTPHLSVRNHRFYERLGYRKVGETVVTDHLTLFDYKKKLSKDSLVNPL